MENQLITFETAKLANEKEFNISQDCGYKSNGTYFDNSQDYDGCKFGYCKEIYLAPTQSLLQRWLREKHNIHVETVCNNLKDLMFSSEIYGFNIEDSQAVTKTFDTYEQALEEGLYKALKLI